MKISLNLILFLLSAINCQDVEHFSSLVQLERLGEQEGRLVLQLEAIADEYDDDYVKK
jgi:type II secretory pathway component PulF